MKYEGRVAVVTGAGSGIGRALTLALTQRGARVAASDIDESALAATQHACRIGSVSTYRVDVGDRSAHIEYAEQVRTEIGPVSLLFNNAGVDLLAGVGDMTWEDFDWLMNINVDGVIASTKAFLPQLIAAGTPQRPARLVNLSSAFGLIAMPYQGAYCTSKFAVRGFTEALRQEMIIEDQPVTVHCVHPGVVRTNFAANMRAAPDDPDAKRIGAVFDRAALTNADKAAALILRGIEKNKARILVGPDGYVAAAVPRVLGAGYSGLLARMTRLSGSAAVRMRRAAEQRAT